MKRAVLAAALGACVMALVVCTHGKNNPEHYNIILIGATGDLAKKYLWKALFNLFSEKFIKHKVPDQIHVRSLFSCLPFLVGGTSFLCEVCKLSFQALCA